MTAILVGTVEKVGGLVGGEHSSMVPREVQLVTVGFLCGLVAQWFSIVVLGVGIALGLMGRRCLEAMGVTQHYPAASKWLLT